MPQRGFLPWGFPQRLLFFLGESALYFPKWPTRAVLSFRVLLLALRIPKRAASRLRCQNHCRAGEPWKRSKHLRHLNKRDLMRELPRKMLDLGTSAGQIPRGAPRYDAPEDDASVGGPGRRRHSALWAAAFALSRGRRGTTAHLGAARRDDGRESREPRNARALRAPRQQGACQLRSPSS